jgi:galactokinase
MKEIELFVPGRLCLFGEHSDWAGAYRTIDPSISVGHCIAVGTNQGISATVRPHSDKLMITSKLPFGKVIGPEVIEMDESNLHRVAKEGSFFSYCAGVAYYFRTRHKVAGLIIRTSMDLPIKRGLSSSAAICVLIAKAFNSTMSHSIVAQNSIVPNSQEFGLSGLGSLFANPSLRSRTGFRKLGYNCILTLM